MLSGPSPLPLSPGEKEGVRRGFALTPALSPGERENFRARFGGQSLGSSERRDAAVGGRVGRMGQMGRMGRIERPEGAPKAES